MSKKKTRKDFIIWYNREKTERKKLQKDLELEHTLRIRLENINYDLVQVLSFIKEHVLLDGGVLRADFQWDLDIEENGELLKEYLK